MVTFTSRSSLAGSANVKVRLPVKSGPGCDNSSGTVTGVNVGSLLVAVLAGGGVSVGFGGLVGGTVASAGRVVSACGVQAEKMQVITRNKIHSFSTPHPP